MIDIILLGCGEHAKMVIDNIEQGKKYRIVGLTTNDESELNRKIYNYNVVCKDEELPDYINKNSNIKGYFLGIGNMKVREKVSLWLKDVLDIDAVNIIHPTAIISEHSVMGTGNIFEAYTKVANDVRIGNDCIVNSFTAINHDQIVGNNVLLAGSVSLAGKTIGDNTIIADGASIGFKKSVGKNCIIGDGAVVTRDIEDFSIAYGNPARVIRKNI